MTDDLLAGVAPPVTLDDMIRCVERELEFRRRVYPRQVASGKMAQGAADEELRRMEAVYEFLIFHSEGDDKCPYT